MLFRSTACGLAFLALAGGSLPARELALLAQRAENQFVGVNCGILDQFAVGLCTPGHALLLDCKTQETRNVPLAAGAPVFFVLDTAKSRELAESGYNERRAQCEDAAREFGVRLKLNPLKRVVQGKRVVLVDDSIVRGTTMRYIVNLLRDGGATEVHVRISSPPYRSSCYYGIDTSSPKELIASTKEVEHIRKHIGADTLHYLPLEQLVEAVGPAATGHCLACFTGDYPVQVPAGTAKYLFDEVSGDGGR